MSGTERAQQHQPPRFWVLDSPRTCSQVFFKLFSQHPQLTQIWHPMLMAAFVGHEAIQPRLHLSERAKRTYEEEWTPLAGPDDSNNAAQHNLMTQVEELESNGKYLFANEHVFCLLKQDIVLSLLRDSTTPLLSTNPTCLPDKLYETLTPLLLIRNPILTAPSVHRTQLDVNRFDIGDEGFQLLASLRWSRVLFDHLQSQGRTPIVVDAEDVVVNPDFLRTHLCPLLGINPDGVKDTWPSVPKEHWPSNHIIVAFSKTILESNGVERRPIEPLDLDREAVKWAREFGEKAAKALRVVVEAEMPDYDYLRRFKLSS